MNYNKLSRDEELLAGIQTPAYVYDETVLLADAGMAGAALSEAKAHLLFAMKSFSSAHGLARLVDHVDGFHASSLFEAKLAREILGQNGQIHVTTPALIPDEFDELCQITDMLSFNSLTQWDRYKSQISGKVRCSLRINPGLSFIKDERYDPCRRHSKLGVPIADVHNVMIHDPDRLEGITGLLVHSNSDSDDFRELLTTVNHLDRLLGPLLSKLKWIDLGGGYLFYDPGKLEPLRETVSILRSKYGLEVYMEPGASISRRAGNLVATVLDIFSSDGKSVVILDASVNHIPEVFEFQDEPDVRGDIKIAGHRYILAGATCLAGDVFGEYDFAEPLQPGSKVVFENIGAYSTVKAHMFNGVNLPSIYCRRADGTYDLKKRFTYQEFKTHLGRE